MKQYAKSHVENRFKTRYFSEIVILCIIFIDLFYLSHKSVLCGISRFNFNLLYFYFQNETDRGFV